MCTSDEKKDPNPAYHLGFVRADPKKYRTAYLTVSFDVGPNHANSGDVCN